MLSVMADGEAAGKRAKRKKEKGDDNRQTAINLQLSISSGQICESIGNSFRSIEHIAVTVSLQQHSTAQTTPHGATWIEVP